MAISRIPQTTREIRVREGELGDRFPVSGLTAHVMKEDMERCLPTAMTGHISTPLDCAVVRKVVRSVGSPGLRSRRCGGGKLPARV